MRMDINDFQKGEQIYVHVPLNLSLSTNKTQLRQKAKPKS